MNRLVFEKAGEDHTLVKEYQGAGWVEIVGQHYQITYDDRFPWNSNSPIASSIGAAFAREDRDYLGLIHTLANLRLREPFLLPIFFQRNDDSDYECVCGLSRRTANMIAGFENHCKTIYITPHGTAAIGSPIQSTQHFLDLYQLNDVDHTVTFENPKPGHYRVISSVLTNSVYQDAGKHHFNRVGHRIMYFWQKYLLDGQIKIHIHCADDIKPLVRSTWTIDNGRPLFDIVWQDPDPTGFSFGRIMHHLAHHSQDELHLWIWATDQTVTLESLIPWAHRECSCYYTQNKKAVLLAPFDRTGFSIIGDFVK